jgi:hypothetical protein
MAPKVADTADKIVDGAIKGIDALFFTDEEKSRASLEAINLWIKTQEVIANENTARSITRRVLAIMIIAFNLLAMMFTIAIYPFNVAWATFTLSLLSQFGFATGAVVVFYFGYYGFKQIVGEKK